MGQVLLDGAAADGALVRITGPNEFATSTTADANGVFGLIDLQPGRYTLSLRDLRTGQTFTATVDVRAGAVTTLALPARSLPLKYWIPVAMS
jgi:hypothetical protein